jgi:hypothetical protein
MVIIISDTKAQREDIKHIQVHMALTNQATMEI